MNAEEVYERIVARAEEMFAPSFRIEAQKGLIKAAKEGLGTDRDYRRDCAVDAIEAYAFKAEDLQTVRAADITDMACEIAEEVERDDWLSSLLSS